MSNARKPSETASTTAKTAGSSNPPQRGRSSGPVSRQGLGFGLAFGLCLFATFTFGACSSNPRTFRSSTSGGNDSVGGQAGETPTAGSTAKGGASSARGGAQPTGDAGADSAPEAGAAGAAGSTDIPPECEGKDKRCTDGAPEQCVSGAWTKTQNQCAVACVEGACAECLPEAVDCSGKVPRHCSTSGKWEEGTACPQECQDGKCVTECTDKSTRCDAGTTFQTCSAQGTWSAGKTCDFVCDPKEGCIGKCKGDQVRCSTLHTNVPESCDAHGEWASADACSGKLPACSEGHCVACTLGDRRCTGSVPQHCDSNHQWVNETACADDTPVCVNSTGTCACSDAQSARCTAGNTPEVCNNGSWIKLSACANAAPYCSVGKCKECQAPSKRCGAHGLEQCQNGDWVPEQSCANGCENNHCLTTTEAPGVVGCGSAGLTCATGAGCCNASTPSCGSCSDANSAQSIVYSKCDGPSDCSPGTICCFAAGVYVTPHFTSYCTAATSCVSQAGVTLWPVCDPVAPICQSGTTCKASAVAGAKTILSVCQ